MVILQKDDLIATLIAERDMWKGKYQAVAAELNSNKVTGAQATSI